jgi:acyl-CoA thioester hydrolase
VAGGFSWPVRVYWEDTDGGGIVYHASYLRFLERSRTEWLRSLGCSQTALAADPGVVFAVTRLLIDYRRPARLDDALSVVCAAAAVGAASLSFEQRILREAPSGGEELLVTATVKVACVNARTLKPQRIPETLAAVLSSKNL